jgi:tetratricopeptide (TPR) repeat protein
MTAASAHNEYDLAAADFRQGNFRGAKGHLAACIKEGLEVGRAYALLGAMWQAEGDFRKAIAAYRKARAEGHREAELLSGLGDSLFENGDYAEAESVLLNACDAHPDHLAGYLSLGRLLIENRRYAEAALVLERAAAVRPDSVEVFHLLGVARSRMGAFQEAIEALSRAAAMDGDQTPHIYLLWGEAYVALGYMDLAIEKFKASAKIYPLSELFYPAARAYQARQMFSTSLKLYDKALAVAANRELRDEILFNQAEILFEMGEEKDRAGDAHEFYSQAARKLESALECNPGFVAARHHLALIHVKRHAARKASEMLEELVESGAGESRAALVPGDNIGLLGSRFLQLVHLGYARALAGDRDAALDALRQALAAHEVREQVPFQCRILRRMGIILLEQGRYEEALAVWRDLSPLDPDNYYQSRDFLAQSQRCLDVSRPVHSE